MKESPSSEPDNTLTASNYCVSFIDLLGQRNILSGEGLLPYFQSEEEKKNWVLKKLRESVGAIDQLQRDAKDFLQAARSTNSHALLTSLSPEVQDELSEIENFTVKTQRWSDGLVSFVCLRDQVIKFQMTRIFDLIGYTGTLCFLGLCNQHPLRGAIEISWGVELHPKELYGPAVSRAYNLENEIAQYPRIVIGPDVINYLERQSLNQEDALFSHYNSNLAKLCLEFFVQDIDGHWILHYLGEEFKNAITKGQHEKMYWEARNFILRQLDEHQADKNSKLAFRYSHLLKYFDDHKPQDD